MWCQLSMTTIEKHTEMFSKKEKKNKKERKKKEKPNPIIIIIKLLEAREEIRQGN